MKNNKWLIFILIICVLAGWIFLRPKNEEKKTVIEDNKTEESEEITPEEIKEKKEVTVEIVSPEEESFIPRQARMWQAKVNNFESDYGNLGTCEWKFYLNENNDEVLYKEQEIKIVLSTGGDNTCGFTSTFIESRGKLRAEVTVLVKDAQENILETYKGERNYIVQ